VATLEQALAGKGREEEEKSKGEGKAGHNEGNHRGNTKNRMAMESGDNSRVPPFPNLRCSSPTPHSRSLPLTRELGDLRTEAAIPGLRRCGASAVVSAKVLRTVLAARQKPLSLAQPPTQAMGLEPPRELDEAAA